MSKKKYLPKNNDALFNWLENFIDNFSLVNKELDLKINKSSELKSLIKIVMNDIKKAELGIYNDMLRMSQDKKFLLIQVEDIICKVRMHSMYNPSNHGKKLLIE